MKAAVHDDHQNVALGLADRDAPDAAVDVFSEPFSDGAAATAAPADYEVSVATRERTAGAGEPRAPIAPFAPWPQT
jgi:hypothetical protein